MIVLKVISMKTVALEMKISWDGTKFATKGTRKKLKDSLYICSS